MILSQKKNHVFLENPKSKFKFCLWSTLWVYIILTQQSLSIFFLLGWFGFTKSDMTSPKPLELSSRSLDNLSYSYGMMQLDGKRRWTWHGISQCGWMHYTYPLLLYIHARASLEYHCQTLYVQSLCIPLGRYKL